MVPKDDQAVALRYTWGDKGPVIVAKGKKEQAIRLKSLAEKYDIDIIEDEVLVQALDLCSIDQVVPGELFPVLAEIFRFVFEKR